MTRSVLSPLSPTQPPFPWRTAIADTILIALIGGPVAAPFFISLDIFPFPLVAQIIYFMGGIVCPQPEMGIALNPPHLMSVCMRCYGVLLALVTTRLLFMRDRGQGRYWLHQYRFQGAAIASVIIWAYLLEMLAEIAGWWTYDNGIVTLFGYIAGLGIGLFLTPVIYRRPAAY